MIIRVERVWRSHESIKVDCVIPVNLFNYENWDTELVLGILALLTGQLYQYKSYAPMMGVMPSYQKNCFLDKCHKYSTQVLDVCHIFLELI